MLFSHKYPKFVAFSQTRWEKVGFVSWKLGTTGFYAPRKKTLWSRRAFAQIAKGHGAESPTGLVRKKKKNFWRPEKKEMKMAGSYFPTPDSGGQSDFKKTLKTFFPPKKKLIFNCFGARECAFEPDTLFGKYSNVVTIKSSHRGNTSH